MNFIDSLVLIYGLVGDDENLEENIVKLKNAFSLVTENPRDEENIYFSKLVFCIVFDFVESLYGDSEAVNIFNEPNFSNRPQSQIFTAIDQSDCLEKFGISIGVFVNNWEQFFYEVCHEVVHLLNPIKDASLINVSAIEEGVAVKFAEQMYLIYITPYTGSGPDYSPKKSVTSQYFEVYDITRKIPDSILKEVRALFGKFYDVKKTPELKNILGGFLTEIEIDTLCKPFRYPF